MHCSLPLLHCESEWHIFQEKTKEAAVILLLQYISSFLSENSLYKYVTSLI
jgi:hypothetical protein